jgi:hypothetical protein
MAPGPPSPVPENGKTVYHLGRPGPGRSQQGVAVELNRETILRTLEEHLSELQRLGVQRLGLFGSYLHGRPRAGSDVDLLVRFDRPSFDSYMDTKFLLEDLLGREVDLVTEQALKPAVRHVRDQAAYVPGL